MIYLFILLMAVIIACLIYDCRPVWRAIVHHDRDTITIMHGDRSITITRKALVEFNDGMARFSKAMTDAGMTVEGWNRAFRRVARAQRKAQPKMKRYRSFKSIRRDYERTT